MSDKKGTTCFVPVTKSAGLFYKTHVKRRNKKNFESEQVSIKELTGGSISFAFAGRERICIPNSYDDLIWGLKQSSDFGTMYKVDDPDAERKQSNSDRMKRVKAQGVIRDVINHENTFPMKTIAAVLDYQGDFSTDEELSIEKITEFLLDKAEGDDPGIILKQVTPKGHIFKDNYLLALLLIATQQNLFELNGAFVKYNNVEIGFLKNMKTEVLGYFQENPAQLRSLLDEIKLPQTNIDFLVAKNNLTASVTNQGD